MMKKYALAVCVLALLCALAFLACPTDSSDNGGGPKPIANDPSAGVMNQETAGQVFDYTALTNGARIDKFKNADVLRAYLSGSRAVLPTGEFSISKIGNLAVVGIAAGAFSPANGAANLGDAGVTKVSLPPTITEIAADAFTGMTAAGGGQITLEIPQEVWDTLPPEVKTGLASAADTGTDPDSDTDGNSDTDTLPSLTGSVSIYSMFSQESVSVLYGSNPHNRFPLMANTSGLNGSGAISYQWMRDDAEISGATGIAYTPAAADVGAVIKVRVSRAGNSGTVSSPGTSPVTTVSDISDSSIDPKFTGTWTTPSNIILVVSAPYYSGGQDEFPYVISDGNGFWAGNIIEDLDDPNDIRLIFSGGGDVEYSFTLAGPTLTLTSIRSSNSEAELFVFIPSMEEVPHVFTKQ
jgi:hypothetical protein